MKNKKAFLITLAALAFIVLVLPSLMSGLGALFGTLLNIAVFGLVIFFAARFIRSRSN
jgi:hypothetical protein